MSVLTLNCGSSSVKYSVYDEDHKAFVCRGVVERVGQKGGRLKHRDGEQERITEQDCPDHAAAVELVLKILPQENIRAVGHRVVHGGEKFSKSARVTPELIRVVEEVAELAPLHNPPNLAGIRAAQKLLPEVPHVAVFDTAFHQTMEPPAFVYPLPYEWYGKYGIRRYGFHGTSHLYVSARASVLLERPLAELKIVTLHVGNGASAAAIAGARSVDTSMGFTPLEGLVMGTRCGWIDPAVPLYVMEREGLDTDEMDRVLNKQSGLVGITGGFYDRRDILKNAEAGDPRCRLALEIEARSLKKTIGSYAACLGGLDAVVFTAGVGENAPSIRARALDGLEFLGIHLDPQRNEKAVGGLSEEIITADGSPVKVLVIPTNEALVIVEDTLAVVDGRDVFYYSFGP
jgi:acetate kinase